MTIPGGAMPALIVVLACAAAARLAYVLVLGDAIGADEAVNGLMAVEMLRGASFPLVMWEAQYAGTLVSVLAAGIFATAGSSVLGLRLAVLPLALVGVGAVTAGTRRLWGPTAGVMAGLLLAVGPPVFASYTGHAIGGYPEVLAFGGLVFWCAVDLRARPRDLQQRGRWAALGAAAGFGTYSLLFVLPLAVGAAAALVRARGLRRGEAVAVLGGFAVGLTPFVIHNVLHPAASVLRLGGRVLEVSAAQVADASLAAVAADAGWRYGLALLRVPSTLLGSVAAFFGLPGSPLLGAAIIAGVAALVCTAPTLSEAGRFGRLLVAASAVATVLFMWGARLDAPRHAVALWVAVVPALAAALARLPGRWLSPVAAGLVLAFAAPALTAATAERHQGSALGALVNALDQRGVRAVYTDYFIAYPLIFVSGGRIVATPEAGPSNVDRYPPFTAVVRGTPDPAYVFHAAGPASEIFAEQMRQHARAFTQERIAGFDIYQPAGHVRPDELRLLRRFAP